MSGKSNYRDMWATYLDDVDVNKINPKKFKNFNQKP